MKILFKKIIGISFTVLFVLSFSACEKKVDYKFNANNGFVVESGPFRSPELYGIKEGKVFCLDLESGEIEYTTMSSQINRDSIIGLFEDGEKCFTINNDIIVSTSLDSIGEKSSGGAKSAPSYYDDEEISDIGLTISRDNISSIALLNPYHTTLPCLISLSEKILTVYEYYEIGLSYRGWNNKNYTLEKEYESVFFLVGNMIGLVNGKEIDFIQIDTELNKYGKNEFRKFGSINKHIVLDKQYDAYVGCYINYQDLDDGRKPYLGCIKKNKIKFYDLNKGEFAKIPQSEKEMCWTF